MTASRIRRFSVCSLAAVALCALAPPALAQQVSHERDIVNLRLGQRILVDDGSCPAGQIKEVAGSRMTASGIIAVKKCIPRRGTKTR